MKTKKALINSLLGIGSLLSLAALGWALDGSFQGLRPAGDILSPSLGIWRHQPVGQDEVVSGLAHALSEAGLSAVAIRFDTNEVPHLKSESETALYFAQGFVTAYYRLWQMDFLSRIAAGEVSEILGAKALPMDRFFRRMRIPAAARASAELMNADPVTQGPLAAYTRGVNARIGKIGITNLPIEYRLFGLLPEVWTEDRAAYLLKFMAWELTGYLYDFKMTASKTKLSHEIFEYLFPINAAVPGTILREWRAKTSNQPIGASSLTRRISNQSWMDVPEEVRPEPSNGSNNWAVPAKSMINRRALLANDLHLGYGLPSLWFSIQLTSPKMNVYGASLPGAPGVIVGFTESMGWAVTNGTDDVLDWYSLRFRDEKKQEYLFEGSWRPVVARDEEIRIAGQPSETIKSRETHVGPIVFDESEQTPSEKLYREVPSGLAVQWTGFQASNELRSFLLLNRGEYASDCLKALRGYVSPAQNFVCADRGGKIVYMHAGLFPDRRGRDGRIVVDAAYDADLWQGMLPVENTPTFETSTELVVTANQAPFNGDLLPQFGWFFAPPYRALQIRSVIDSRKQWKPADMVQVQANTTSWMALSFKKIVLREGELEPLKTSLEKSQCRDEILDEASGTSLRVLLASWNGDYDAENTMAPMIQEWIETLEKSTWTRVIGSEDLTNWPDRWRFFEILEKDANTKIWDDSATPVVENLNIRLHETLANACKNIRAQFGPNLNPVWSTYQSTNIRHAARIPGLGRKAKAGGVRESIFANKGEHGPTWKMIVSFEDKPLAWTMIPGGQSGDPASLFYDNQIAEWARGEMRPAEFDMRDSQKLKRASP